MYTLLERLTGNQNCRNLLPVTFSSILNDYVTF